MSILFGSAGGASQASVDANTLAIAALADNIGIPFGAKHDTLGRLSVANGKSSDPDETSKPKTRQPISLDGTIKKVAYQTLQGDSTTEIKIHVNGSVVDTFTLANINAALGGVETRAIAVSAGDYVEVEWSAGTQPNESTWFLLLEK